MDRCGRGIRMRAVACSGARDFLRWDGGTLGGLSCGQRFDLKQESVYAAHDYGHADGNIGGGDGVPEFAVNKDLSSWRNSSLSNTGLSHESFDAGYNLVPSSLKS